MIQVVFAAWTMQRVTKRTMKYCRQLLQTQIIYNDKEEQV